MSAPLAAAPLGLEGRSPALGRGMHPIAYRLFLLWCIVSSSFAVFLRRLLRGPAEPSWSLPFEVAVDVTRRFMRQGVAQAKAGLRINDAPTPRSPRLTHAVRLHDEQLAGLCAEVHTPARWKAGAPTLLYWHGGGYISCSPRTHRELVSQIAHHSGARCVVPDYGKAPAYPFPLALDAAMACFHALLQSGVAPGTVLVGGDSAGGGLSLAMMLRLRDEGSPLPRAAVLLSPWVDLTASGESVQRATLDILDGEMLVTAAALYAGGAPLTAPLVSPLYAPLSGLPPMLVQTGGAEVLRSENERLVERARQAGVSVRHELAPGMVHVFQTLALLGGHGTEALRSIGRFVREQTER